VLVAALVVPQRPLARRVGDMADVQLGALGLGGLPRELERVQRGARVTAGAVGDRGLDLGRDRRAECSGAAPRHLHEVPLVERLELVDGAP